MSSSSNPAPGVLGHRFAAEQSLCAGLGRSLARHGAKRIVFLNTGVTQSTGLPLGLAARELHAQQHIPVLLVSWDDLESPELRRLLQQRAGTHADELETSLMLFLRPDLVHMERAIADYREDGSEKGPGYRRRDFSRRRDDPDYSASGVYGDPTLATAEKGRRALEIMTTQWILALRRFATAPATR